MQIDVQFSPDEETAIDAALTRARQLQLKALADNIRSANPQLSDEQAMTQAIAGAEPAETREALVARMAKKLAAGWANELLTVSVDDHLRTLKAKLRAVPTTAERLTVVDRCIAEIDKALQDG